MNIYFILFTILLIPIIITTVYAEDSVLISVSNNLDEIIFDGKWTHSLEWKHSSYNLIQFDDGTKIHMRSAHQDNFIYIHLNFQSDTSIDKGSDSAVVCFDTKNDKTIIPKSDDYCFSITLGNKHPFTYQGSATPAINGYFVAIPNDKNFVAIGSASDNFDRYSSIPHTSYEFKIPLDVLGRSDNYGFYVSVFDANSQNHYSWPTEIKKQSLISISSPSQWGDLISPDKSLPEFNSPILFAIFIPLILIFLVMNKLNLFKIGISNAHI